MPTKRLENKRFEKNIKFFKFAGILTLILAVLRIAMDPNIFNGSGNIADFISTLIPIAFFIQYRKTAHKWGGQFIEWTDNEISFKSRKYDKTTIALADIKSIEIKLDFIILKTKENTYEINIEDYTEYKDRLQLKSNFQEIKEKLNTNFILTNSGL